VTRTRVAGFLLVLLISFSCSFAVGCGSDPVVLGPSPDILWWTDHETGTSDWVRNAEGSTWTSAGGQLDVVTTPVRSGRYALRSIVMSPPNGSPLSAAVAQRNGIMPVDAYYSAWYYVPAAVTATGYWLFFKFRSRVDAADATTNVDVWDFDFLPGSNGGMEFSLFGHVNRNTEPALAMPPVPIGQWFQVEAFLRATNDNTGRLTIWVDGTPIFDVQARPTLPSPFVEWQVGGITERITPPMATFYVDDAAISTRRLGPDYPIFWRGN
jgi:hypothetical protein